MHSLSVLSPDFILLFVCGGTILFVSVIDILSILITLVAWVSCFCYMSFSPGCSPCFVPFRVLSFFFPGM